MSKGRKLTLHFTGAGVAKLAPPLVQLVLLLFVARAGSLDDVGLLALGSAVSFLCGGLAELGLTTSLSTPEVAFGTAGPPLRATRRLRLAAAGLGSALYTVLWAAGLGGHDPVLLLVAPLPLALALAYGYAGAMNATARLRYEIPVSIGESVVILAVALLGALVVPALTASLAALTIGRGAGTLVRMLIVRGLPQSPTGSLPTVNRAQLPFALATLGWVVQGQVDMVAIGFVGPLALAAIYGPLMRTAYSVLLSAEALSWALFGGANPDEGRGSSRLGRHWRTLMIGIGAVVALAFAGLAEPFLRLLLDRDLPEMGTAVALFALVIVIRFGTLTAHVDIIRAGRQQAEVPVLVASAVLLGAAGGIAAGEGSLTGMAVARLASEVLIAAGFVVIRQRTREPASGGHGAAQPQSKLPAPMGQGGPGLQPRVESSGVEERPRVLILSPFPPSLEVGHGGARVLAQLVMRLAERVRISVLYLRHPAEPPGDDRILGRVEFAEEVERRQVASLRARALRFIGWRIALVGARPFWVSDLREPAYEERLRELVEAFRPDVVQVEHTVMAQYLPAIDRSAAARLLVEHDPDSGAIRKGLVAPRLDARAWRRFRRRALQAVDAAVAFTERDRAALEPIAGSTPIIRIPLGTDFADRRFASGDSGGGVLFVGSFVHPPNADAARRLVSSIFPRVRSVHPDCLLHVVGDRPPRDLVDGASPGVVVTGHVPDVAPYMERAAVVVAPVREGGGMRVKVLEALAAGKALVASPLAAEGLDVTDGEQLRLATTDAEFATQIAELLSDDDERRALAERARKWAERNLGWDASIEAYERQYRDLIAGRS